MTTLESLQYLITSDLLTFVFYAEKERKNKASKLRYSEKPYIELQISLILRDMLRKICSLLFHIEVTSCTKYVYLFTISYGMLK